jgi:hypothetical protein
MVCTGERGKLLPVPEGLLQITMQAYFVDSTSILPFAWKEHQIPV